MPGLIERQQVGKREDLADIISLLDTRSTPMVSMIPKGEDLKNMTFDWQLDAYELPNIAGVLDGSDVDSFENAARNRVKVSGRAMKVRRTAMVSDFAENVSDVAGLGKKGEMAHSVVKKLEELKRDMESIIGGSQDSVAEDGINPYRTRGLGQWISSSAGTDLPVPTAFLTPAASIDGTQTSTLAESNIQAVLESVYKQTGKRKRYTLFAGTKLKRQFTFFSQYNPTVSSNTSIRLFNHDGDNQMIESNVDFFAGDFGEIEVLPDLWLARDDASSATTGQARGYLVDMELLKLRYNRRPRFQPLEDKGGGPRGLVDAVFALLVLNPLGLGKFNATTL
jgi:hypothetical protein